MERMRIQISKVEGSIGVAKDFRDMDRGEAAHLMAELQIIQEELLGVFEDADEGDDAQMRLDF